jgi:ABC-type nitrate/sulfonate/bicarbonate transport system permease component
MTAGPLTLRLAGAACLILGWHVVVQTSGTTVIPTPATTAARLIEGFADGWLWADLGASLKRVILGVLIGGLVAFAASVPVMLWRPAHAFVDGAISLVRPIPPIAWVPVALIVFGVGDGAAVATVALASFFPIVLGLISGISRTTPEHLIAASVFGRSRLATIAHVILPSAAVSTAHALRVAAGLGWFCVVAAEMLGASRGLGFGVQVSGLNLDLYRLFAYIAMIGMIGALIDRLIVKTAAVLVPWAPEGAI